ncbi:MAG: redoxin domain-containing protein [Bacteroidaceae bacterium]|nr:redoxin domain-containing protein [Bacteroidaceae bacterium]
MKQFLFGLGIAAVMLSACDNTPKFTVQGYITDAKDQMLYFENIGLNGVEILDSAKLGSKGDFRFAGPVAEAPEFYRLRIDSRIINLAIDSTETVKVNAPFEGMATNYTIDGGDNNQKIKELSLKQIELQRNINTISQSKALAPGEIQDSIVNTIARYKQEVEKNYIYVNPGLSYAYFALFQTVNGYLIFDPINDKRDVRCFAAVATSWDNRYPHSDRAGNLHNIAIRGMKNVRGPQVREVEIDPDKIQEANVVNLALPDVKGRIRNLTDLQGKVVLLDFTIYNHTSSAARNMQLRDLYDKYKNRGFEIYQVSLDSDEHFWKTNADNLPWICVRDANGLYSTNLTIYGVTNLPTFFVLDRTSTPQGRSESVEDLEAEINKYL